MRIKSEVWVQSLLRICQVHDAMAVVVRRGDPDAGVIFVKLMRDRSTARLYGAGLSADADSFDRTLSWVFDPPDRSETEIDAHLARELRFDPDIWVVEIEHCRDLEVLDDWIRGRR